MHDDESFLFANERFYAAFAAGDTAAMDALWAKSAPLLCVHPGAQPLAERPRIMESWHAILGDPGVAEMRMDTPRLQRHGEFVLVSCYERLGGGTLLGLNGFVFEDGTPRMVLHQAGPCHDAPSPPPPSAAGEAPLH